MSALEYLGAEIQKTLFLLRPVELAWSSNKNVVLPTPLPPMKTLKSPNSKSELFVSFDPEIFIFSKIILFLIYPTTNSQTTASMSFSMSAWDWANLASSSGRHTLGNGFYFLVNWGANLVKKRGQGYRLKRNLPPTLGLHSNSLDDSTNSNRHKALNEKAAEWLGDQESNLGSQIQNLLSCP